MKKRSTYEISILSLFIAIILLQNIVPMFGYLPIGPLDLTTIHLTVIVAGLVLGVKEGAIIGGTWGIITFIRAFVWPTSPLAPIVFTNPLIAILPRILVGVVAALVFQALRKKRQNETGAMIIASVLASLVNTILVLGLMYLFYKNAAAGFYTHGVVEKLLPFLLATIATNGIPEAILAGIVGPLLSKPLLKLTRKRH